MAAVLTERPVKPDVIENGDGARVESSSRRSSLGNRVVGVTTILGVIALVILLGHAMFEAVISDRHVRINQLEEQISASESDVRELRLRYENAVAPNKVAQWVDEESTLRQAESVTQIRVRPEDIALRNTRSDVPSQEPTGVERFSVDHLLAETVTFESSRSER